MSAARTTSQITPPPNPRVDSYLDADYFERTLRDDVLSGLTSDIKELPPKWFYDDRGSALFDEITRLPEYYPTEAERSILTHRSAEIARASGADTLVELGSGTADKVRLLLDALDDADQLRRYIPFDVSESTLRLSADALVQEYEGLIVHGVVGDFEHHLDRIPQVGRRLIALFGGTIGNFAPVQRKGLLSDITTGMRPGDTFLLGTDLVKDRPRLVRAYDDAAGVTAAFNKNVLAVLNHRLGAHFDLDQFDHVALFDETDEWIEMRLRSRVEQTVRIDDVNLDVHFAKGEELRTEISAKFRREGIEHELGAVGLRLTHWWTDPRGDYALSLSVLD